MWENKKDSGARWVCEQGEEGAVKSGIGGEVEEGKSEGHSWSKLVVDGEEQTKMAGSSS